MADRSPRDIERDIERERAELAASLDALTEKFSMDNMVRTVSDQVQSHGGETVANFGRTVKANPAAAVLAGAGIAWLMASGAKTGRDASHRTARGPGPYVDSDYEGGARPLVVTDSSDEPEFATRRDLTPDNWEDSSASEGQQPRPAYAAADSRPTASGFANTYPAEDFTSRIASADREIKSGYTGTSGVYEGGSAGGSKGVWERFTDNVRSGYASAKGYATDLRDNMMEGTESMDHQGQDRVAQARARAYAAQARAEEMSRRAQREAVGFFNENPLVTGALALAAGAIVGSMLPRTQREDEAFGAYRDNLFEEAERVFHEEKARAEGAASAALREAKQVAVDAKDKVTGGMDAEETVHEAEAASRSAVKRVADAAKDGARKNSTV